MYHFKVVRFGSVSSPFMLNTTIQHFLNADGSPVASNIQQNLYVDNIICDWLRENPPLTHKYKYLEISNSIIQSVISREGSKLHVYNSLQIYSYLIAIRLPTAQSTASWFSRHFRLFFINTTSTYIGVEGG